MQHRLAGKENINKYADRLEIICPDRPSNVVWRCFDVTRRSQPSIAVITIPMRSIAVSLAETELSEWHPHPKAEHMQPCQED